MRDGAFAYYQLLGQMTPGAGGGVGGFGGELEVEGGLVGAGAGAAAEGGVGGGDGGGHCGWWWVVVVGWLVLGWLGRGSRV